MGGSTIFIQETFCGSDIMNRNFALFAILVLLASLVTVESEIMCYVSSVGSLISIQKGCTICQSTLTTNNQNAVTRAFACVASCTASNANGVEVKCCNGDLCQVGSAPVTVSQGMATLVGVVMMHVLHKSLW